MNEPTQNKVPSHDWTRPKSPNYLFTQEERKIVIKCINIVIDEYYFHDRDFRSVMGSNARQRLTEIVSKIENDQDLSKDDCGSIEQAVMQVAMFPLMHKDEVCKQFDFDLRHLVWFAAYIRDDSED